MKFGTQIDKKYVHLPSKLQDVWMTGCGEITKQSQKWQSEQRFCGKLYYTYVFYYLQRLASSTPDDTNSLFDIVLRKPLTCYLHCSIQQQQQLCLLIVFQGPISTTWYSPPQSLIFLSLFSSLASRWGYSGHPPDYICDGLMLFFLVLFMSYL